jgi:hypothetical protein
MAVLLEKRCVLSSAKRTVDTKGIDSHHVNNFGISTVGGIVNTQRGPIIAIMQQCALFGKGDQSIPQVNWNGIKMT